MHELWVLVDCRLRGYFPMSATDDQDTPSEPGREQAKPGDCVLPRFTDDELRTFVNDLASGQIFTSNHLPASDLDMMKMIFMPLAFGALGDYTPEDVADIGIVYEYLDAQGPRSVNGYPMFMSCRLMRKGDWERARVAVVAENERRKHIELPPEKAVEGVNESK